MYREDYQRKKRSVDMPLLYNPACPPQNCIQHWALAGPPTAGTWGVVITFGGTDYTASSISYAATAATIETALDSALSTIGTNLVTVTGGPIHQATIAVEFTGLLGYQQIDLARIVHGSLLGTGYGVVGLTRYAQIGRA